ncbi:hypothetical protein J7M22_13510 [Candidatus Poribacteria bacterium]|nr:hypothetical protein [Candidatus Poribacteria bacterium]
MLTVRVLSRSTGRPVKGARVSVEFSGISRGITSPEYTDSQGEAHFDASPGEGKVFVNGKTVYKGRIAGRMVVCA